MFFNSDTSYCKKQEKDLVYFASCQPRSWYEKLSPIYDAYDEAVPVREDTCPGPSVLWGRVASSYPRLFTSSPPPSAATRSPFTAWWKVNKDPSTSFFQFTNWEIIYLTVKVKLSEWYLLLLIHKLRNYLVDYLSRKSEWYLLFQFINWEIISFTIKVQRVNGTSFFLIISTLVTTAWSFIPPSDGSWKWRLPWGNEIEW